METHATDRTPYLAPELLELGRVETLTLGDSPSTNNDGQECMHNIEPFPSDGPSRY